MRALAAELRERVGEELDYEIEAQNHRAMARAWRGHPFVHVPAVDTTLSSRRVLVTELLVGRRFEDVKRLGEAERDRFGEIVFRFFFGTLQHLRRASGDPHPGNYLLLDDGRVGFLDFGLMRVVDRDVPRRRAARSRGRGRARRRRRRPRAAWPRSATCPDPVAFEPERLLGAAAARRRVVLRARLAPPHARAT